MNNDTFNPGQIGDMQSRLFEMLAGYGLAGELGTTLVTIVSAIVVLALARAADALAPRILRAIQRQFADKLDSEHADAWQAALLDHTLARRSAHLTAALTVYLLTPYALSAYPELMEVVRIVVKAYVLLVVIVALNAFLGAAAEVKREDLLEVGIPSRFISQTLQLGIWIVGVLLIVSTITKLPVAALITGLAGMVAVLLVVFRDTLLGYVAGVQIVENDLVRERDWVEIPKYNANGAVIDIGLTTVKVRNWDNTISTVPTYALISEGFKNWRGLQTAGARRIKRSLNVDVDGITFCSSEMLDQLRDSMNPDLDAELVRQAVTAASSQDTGAGLSNLAVYCEYLRGYIRAHPGIRQDMATMVRILPIDAHGIPVEIYCFSADTQWANYERLQESILEHAVCVLPVFGLRPFQLPTTLDPAVPA